MTSHRSRFPKVCAAMIVILPNKGGSAEADRLEFAGLLRQRAFGRKPLHRRGAEEAVTIGRMFENIFGIFGLGYRSAMHEHDNVLVDPQRGLRPLIDQRGALVELAGRGSADRASGGEPEMTDDDIGTGLRHR